MKTLLIVLLALLPLIGVGQNACIFGTCTKFQSDTHPVYTVYLLRDSVIIDTTQTDSTGSYSFCKLYAGSYSVMVQLYGKCSEQILIGYLNGHDTIYSLEMSVHHNSVTMVIEGSRVAFSPSTSRIVLRDPVTRELGSYKYVVGFFENGRFVKLGQPERTPLLNLSEGGIASFEAAAPWAPGWVMLPPAFHDRNRIRTYSFAR